MSPGNLKKNLTLAAVVLLCAAQALLIACSAFRMRVPRVPRHFGKVMGAGRRVGIVAYLARGKKRSPRARTYNADSFREIQTLMEKTLTRFGYYQIVDIENRRERLRKIAYSQSGLTKEVLEVGRELAVDGIIYLKLHPLYKEGILVNVETGESLAYTSLNRNDRSVRRQIRWLAVRLSPVMREINAYLADDLVGVPKDRRDAVEKLLEEGNKNASGVVPDFDKAYKLWNQALGLSREKSASAHWNLALYFWFKGDLTRAGKHFARAEQIGGDDFLNIFKISIYNDFLKEKNRYDGLYED